MSESQNRKVTSWELLDMRERPWRRRANAVSLAAETLDQIPVHHREQALRALGRLYDRAESVPAAQRMLRRWPAAHVLATAGVAAEHYEKATFWPKLLGIVGIHPDPAFQAMWGEAFLDNLRQLDMPTFENDNDAGTRYVGRILLHSGMPTYCLDDFFRIVSWKRSTTPGLTADEFVTWAANKAAGTGFANVDMPVQRFLRYGDEFAVDVSERSFELLDAVAAGNLVDDGLLPQRFCEVAEHFHQQKGIELVAGGGTVAAERGNVRPRLILDPFGQGLLLRLPPVGDAPDGKAVWMVSLDEHVRRVSTESLWPGSAEPAPQTDVAISVPVRTVSVALSGREHLQLSIMVIDDQNPVLTFGEDGELIAQGLPLPAAPVWVLFPGEPESLQVSGATNLIGESPLPPGWSGFSLVHIDLADATSVSVGRHLRTVRRFESARIETAAPVQGIRTSAGLPIFADLPKIHLPKGDAEWDISLHDNAGTVISRRRIGGGDDPNQIWDDVARPVSGDFSVRVRGPWGRGASRTFTLIEGLGVSFSPGWRRFVRGGLQPCVASIVAAPAINLSRTQIDFGFRDRSESLRVGLGAAARSLVVSPPHMTVSHQDAEGAVTPSVRPLILFCEDLQERPGELVLDIGAAAEPSLHVLAHGRLVQTLSPRGSRAGIYRFNLAEIVDTLRVYPQVSLSLSDDGELVVAWIRPRTLFSGIELDGNGLVLTDCVAVDGLNAYLFATRAPWREPDCVPVVDGRVALPPGLINAGPIRVMARIEDPWVPLPTPTWPSRGRSKLIDSVGWLGDGSAEETAISKFLAGEPAESVEVIDFVRLWTVRALLPSLGLGERIAEVSEGIDTEIYGNPAAALVALSGSEAQTDAIPLLVIRSGLAWANLADVHETCSLPWTRRGALPAALISAADSLWSDEEIEASLGVCGDAVTGILDGKDPYASAGHFDGSADLLDQNPSLREQFIQHARLIPQGLLSEDSRVLAAMDLVVSRRDPQLEWLMRNARGVLAEGEKLIRIIGDPKSQRAFDARRHHSRVDGWRVVPAISMAFALAARHAARGHVEAGKWVLREKRPWEDLASVAPQLVTIDLIVAELTVGRRVAEQVGGTE